MLKSATYVTVINLTIICSYILWYYIFTGKAAVEAKNLFYYLTYSGSVNLESLDDISLKKVAKFCHACLYHYLHSFLLQWIYHQPVIMHRQALYVVRSLWLVSYMTECSWLWQTKLIAY